MSGIGENIASLRKKKEITQEELGKALGVSMQAVSRWENGGTPDIMLLPALADYFSVSIDELFGREGGSIPAEAAILRRLSGIPADQRIEEGFRLCWEIQRGIAGDTEYRGLDDLSRYMQCERAHSRVDLDSGMTELGFSRHQNWYFISPEPKDGRYFWLYDREKHTKLFKLLAEPDAYDALFIVCQRDMNPFTARLLEKALKITIERASEILDAFTELKLLEKSTLELDDEKIFIYSTFYRTTPVVPFMTMAYEMVNSADSFVYNSNDRSTPYIRRREQEN